MSKEHLKTYKWIQPGRKILENVMHNKQLFNRECIFPTQPGPVDDRSHLTQYSLFDVGVDGAPLPINSDAFTMLQASPLFEHLERAKRHK